jgi:hypothetical protein
VSSVLDSAVGRMLAAFGVKVSEERVMAFTEAVQDAEQCDACAARAAKDLTQTLKRPPFPAHLVEETTRVQGSAEHLHHIADRKQLGAGDLETWWLTEAPVIIRGFWRELTGDQAIEIARTMYALDYVEPDRDAIGAELGFLDERGPTLERQWWLDTMAHLFVQPVDPSIPVGDR